MIAQGKYRAKGVEMEFGESEKTKSPFVWVDFVVTQGPEEGKRVQWNGYFTPKAEERTLESMRHLGCTFPEGNILDTAGFDTNEVEIEVEHERYTASNGEERVRARVKWVNSGIGGVRSAAKMSQSNAEAFRQRMKGAVLALKAKKQQASDGEIPF